MIVINQETTACQGCSQITAAQLVLNTVGKNVIIVNSTGCLEVTTTTYPNTFWSVPWIHSLFANSAPVGSGIEAALRYKQRLKKTNQVPTVLVQGGDGATFDIGFGALTASWSQGDNFLYICYDNEGYANTGMQSSLATTTNQRPKRDMIAIALAHQVPYIAQTNIAFPLDIKEKVQRALKISGPKYIQILVPCLPGWKIDQEQQFNLAKLATNTGLYPLLEFINGQPYNIQKLPRPIPPVTDYTQPQGRYQKNKKTQVLTQHLQAIADLNIKKYEL